MRCICLITHINVNYSTNTGYIHNYFYMHMWVCDYCCVKYSIAQRQLDTRMRLWVGKPAKLAESVQMGMGAHKCSHP